MNIAAKVTGRSRTWAGQTFDSLRVPNYRRYALGQFISATGAWAGRTAQVWLVLTVLTDHDATAIGLLSSTQFGPSIVLFGVAGALADRFPKRYVMAVAQVFMLISALTLGILAARGQAQMWHVYALSLLDGTASAIDAPARQAFVNEMVPREKVPNAISLNSVTFNMARLIGPAVAGLGIAKIGTGPVLIVNGLTYAGFIVALLSMNPAGLTPAPVSRGKGRVIEGIRYVRRRPDLKLLMLTAFMMGTFGLNFQMTNALMATEVYHKSAAEYGALGSVLAIGALAAALSSARRANPRLRHILVSLGGFTLFSASMACAPSFELFALLLVPTGLFALTVMITCSALIQTRVDDSVRGRVMALYMAIFLGGSPFFSPLIGKLGAVLGAPATILAGTVTCGCLAVAATVYVMRADDIHIRYDRDARLRFLLHRGEISEDIPQKQA